jgi:hypothetical protein
MRILFILAWTALITAPGFAATGVTALEFDPVTALINGSFAATFSATDLSDDTYYDIRFRLPGAESDDVALNWQQGRTAVHRVPIGTVAGDWAISGVRAHQGVNDHRADFVLVSAILKVSSSFIPYPLVELRPATHFEFPAHVDSNSPAFRDGDTFYLFNSAEGQIKRSAGAGLEMLSETQTTRFIALHNRVSHWIEAVWKAPDGILWGWYHAEPWDSVCPNTSLLGRTLISPEIGAAVSSDNGLTWIDLGIIIRADVTTLVCDTANGYFSGGVGDPSVMLDEQQEYLYIFFGTYSGDVAEQGVSVARMKWSERYSPVGAVWRWHNDSWSSPGLDGRSTPVFPATVDWNLPDANAYWGPSIHWNNYLKRYVVLLNRTKNAIYEEEGIYISYSTSLSDSRSWTIPRKILDRGTWYPQVIGVSDKLVDQTARFFDGGISDYEIVFSQIEPACTLRSDQDVYTIGKTAHYDVTSNLEGYGVYWYGTKDGKADVEDVYFGRANMLHFDYGPFKASDLTGDRPTIYSRYFVVKDDVGNPVCQSNTITVTLRPAQ